MTTTYSIFLKHGGRWVRLSGLALPLNGARRLFQSLWIAATLTGHVLSLRRAEEDLSKAEEYSANLKLLEG